MQNLDDVEKAVQEKRRERRDREHSENPRRRPEGVENKPGGRTAAPAMDASERARLLKKFTRVSISPATKKPEAEQAKSLLSQMLEKLLSYLKLGED